MTLHFTKHFLGQKILLLGGKQKQTLVIVLGALYAEGRRL